MKQLNRPVSRRLALAGFGAASAAMILTAEAAKAAPRSSKWQGSRSANGWPIGAESQLYAIEGTDHSVTLASGPSAAVLLHAARRVNYEFDTLRVNDVIGLSTSRTVESPERSNLLSGTAIHIRPGSFPRGSSDNLFPEEVVVFEDIVAEAGGVLAWGGHLDVPDQGLFYIAQKPTSVATGNLATRYDARDRMDASGGAGALDSHDPGRRRAARKFRSRKR